MSKNLPKEWGKIEVGLISYRTSTTSQADHFDLKLNNAVMAFVAECKRKNNVQLCVYSEKKVKQNEVLYGSSVTNVKEMVSLKLILNYIFNSYILYINNGLINKLG